MNRKCIAFGAIGVLVVLITAGLTFRLLAQQQDSGIANAVAPAFHAKDIGKVGVAGNFTVSAGVYELHGSGADIWGRADGFHFLYLPWRGDAEIVARVVSVEKTDPWAKAGIMIRSDLSDTSAHAMVAVTPEKGVTFIRRPQAAGATRDDAHQAARLVRKDGAVVFQQRGSAGVDNAAGSLTALPSPRWIRLVREGARFTAYDSSDGRAWEWLGTEKLDLPSDCYVGLAVSSHDVAKLCRATVDHVSVKTPLAGHVAAPILGTGKGLKSTYFSQMNLTGAVLQRVDPVIDFDWGYAAPMEGIGRNEFSVRWEGELEAQFTEPYAISIVSDDRARVWLDGQLLIDEWYEHGEQASTAVVNLEAGKRYSMRLDYFENRGRAVARLFWSSPSTPYQIVPQTQLYPVESDTNRFESEPVSAPTRIISAPGQWFAQDVGWVGASGGALYTNGGWRIAGAGADIWANADGFHYAYQSLHGDGQIIARITDQENTDPWAKAGIMIRETLDQSSRHVFLAVTPQNGVLLLTRNEKERSTIQDSSGFGPRPAWLKLIRRSGTISAFVSSDGVEWDWVGTRQLDLPEDIFAGLAVTSHDNSKLGSATFDQVSVEPVPPRKPVAPPIGSGNGLAASYFDAATGRVVTRIDPLINFDWDIDSPAEGIAADQFSARWEGYCQAVSDEEYQIKVISDDGARLWFDGKLVIDSWNDRAPAGDSIKLVLRAGQKYSIKLEYYERTLEAVAKLLWSTPTIPEQPIPQSQLYSESSANSVQQIAPTDMSATDATTAGPDAGLAQSSDSSMPKPVVGGDASATIEFRTFDEIPGAAAVARLGEWEAEGTSISAVGRRGSLEYDIHISSDNVYRLEIEGESHNLFDVDPAFYLELSIDGESLGRHVLDATPTRKGYVHEFTPWLNRGVHRLRVSWDNARKARSLQINAIRVQSILGADSDGNGVIDWVGKKLDQENGIERVGTLSTKTASSPETSLHASTTSPLCIEGRGGFLSMMKVLAGTQSVTPQQGIGERWFGNVPLSADQTTTIEVSFQNGGLRRATRVQWSSTDLLASGDLTIRQGDALLFQVGDLSGAVESGTTVRIEADGDVRYEGPAKRVPCAFEKSGIFTVKGIRKSPSGESQERSILVRVVHAAFGEQAIAWEGRQRLWDCPDLPGEATVEYDKRMQLGEDSALPASGKRFRLTIDAGEDRRVLARLGDGGPVLAAASIHGICIYGVSESGAFYGEQYEDGSRLVETAIVQSRVFSDVRVQLNIIVGGVMFEDGTLVKNLRVEDFDPTGLATVHFIMPPGVQTSNCHVTRAFQNETYLGEY